MDSPLMGPPVEDCNRLASIHYLANVFGMYCSTRANPKCKSMFSQWVHIVSDSHSFCYWPSHSCDMTIWKFNPKNKSPRSWVGLKVRKVGWIQHLIASHHFQSMSIGPTIIGIRLSSNLSMKGQCKDHACSSVSQSGSNFLLTHMPFVPCQSATPLQGQAFS